MSPTLEKIMPELTKSIVFAVIGSIILSYGLWKLERWAKERKKQRRTSKKIDVAGRFKLPEKEKQRQAESIKRRFAQYEKDSRQ